MLSANFMDVQRVKKKNNCKKTKTTKIKFEKKKTQNDEI
jgi:hypothetical protein